MNTRTLSRLFVAVIATVCMTSAMAEESNKTIETATAATPTPIVDPVKTPDSDFYKTDPLFWDHGIARMWAGFYVRFTPENVKQYLYGNTVEFANGEKRKIVGSSVNGPYWDVRVEGDKLDYTKVGSPAKFKVVIGTAPTQSPVTSPSAVPTNIQENDEASKPTSTTEPKKSFLKSFF